MKNLTPLAIATALALATTAWAESPLDDALGPKAPDAKPGQVEPAKTDPKPDAAKKPDAKPDNTIVSPDAANQLDFEDLVKKLTGQEKDGAGPAKMLDEVLERMDTSAKRLHEKDPGPVTQETQRRIIMNLDTLIELAKQQQQNSSQSQSQGQSKGQQRNKNTGQKQGDGQQDGNSQGGNTAASRSELRTGNASDAQSNGQDVRERGKEWGNLPDRDRDLIAKYSQEKTVPAYEEAVRKYYEALAEISRNREK